MRFFAAAEAQAVSSSAARVVFASPVEIDAMSDLFFSWQDLARITEGAWLLPST